MKTKQGFTLIELIVSISILGILTVSILTIFSTGFSNIINAGKITKEVFNVKDEMNLRIKNYNDTIVDESFSDKEIVIIFIQDVLSKTVYGKEVVTESDDKLSKRQSVKIVTFIPK